MANTLKFKRGLLAGIPTAALGEPLFTTDTFDLYIGNGTGNTKFQKFIASGTTSQLLRGDGSLLTMPIVLTSPSNGQVLKYNGTSWVNDSDAGITGSGVAGQVAYFTGATTQGGSNNLFWDASNSRLGIGTNNPVNRFQVDGATVGLLTVQSASDRVGIGTTSPNSRLEVYSATGYNVIRSVGGSGGYFETYSTAGVRFASFGSESNGDAYFGTRSNNPLIFLSNNTERARITGGGNFIINNSSTDNGLRFQVTGDGYFSGGVRMLRALTINGASIPTDRMLEVTGTTFVTGATNFGIVNNPTYATPTTIYGYYSSIVTTSATNGYGIFLEGPTGTITNYYSLYSNVGAATGGWNLYMNGTAANYLKGNLYIDTTSPSTTGAYGTPKFSVESNIFSSAQIMSHNDVSGNYSFLGIGKSRGTGASPTAVASGETTGSFVFYGHTGSAYQPMGFINSIVADTPSASSMPGVLIFGTTSISSTSPTERMRLDASGNLGLGVTPSAWQTMTGLQFGEVGSLGANDFGASNLQTFLGNNVYYDNTGFKYIMAGHAAMYRMVQNTHQWNVAASGSANGLITFTQAMTLDASGRLLVGATTSSAAGEILQVTGNTLITPSSQYGTIAANSGLFIKSSTTSANGVIGLTGQGFILQGKDGSSNAYPILLQPYGDNVLIGTTTNSTYKLDVNGTMRVSGASTFNGAMTLSLNQNAGTILSVSNTTSGTASAAYASFTSSNGNLQLGKRSATTNTYKILTANDSFIYNDNSGDIGILNDFASGSIKMAAGGSSTAHFTIASTGAATFSSSVTAASFNGTTNNIFSTAGTEKMRLDSSGQLGLGATPYAWGGSYKSFDFLFGSIANTNAGNVDVAITQNAYFDGTNWISKYTGASKRYVLSDGGHIWFYGASATSGTAITMTQAMILNASGNLGIAMTPSYKLDVTGQARISDAIAIGTTPDTNLPFKILKNINSTVGVRFENTSTGANAFAAVQFGQDVSGGTAFANMVYANSAITESGVYKPSGTAIINTGSGGLNFLAVSQPIRFFTSTGNGTLRAAITNDGDYTHYNGTNPSASTTDAFRMYSADITAGNAAPHFRTENGGIIKLYQQTTAVTSATYIGGAGTTVTDLDTFDGYTIPQIVKALRNAGLLA